MNQEPIEDNSSPTKAKSLRKPGEFKGQFTLLSDFFEEDHDIIECFENSELFPPTLENVKSNSENEKRATNDE